MCSLSQTCASQNKSTAFAEATSASDDANARTATATTGARSNAIGASRPRRRNTDTASSRGRRASGSDAKHTVSRARLGVLDGRARAREEEVRGDASRARRRCVRACARAIFDAMDMRGTRCDAANRGI